MSDLKSYIPLVAILLTAAIMCPVLTKYFQPQLHHCLIKGNTSDPLFRYIVFDINGCKKREALKEPKLLIGWNVLHILLFMTVTFLYPDKYVFIIVCGLAWEVFESLIGHDNWMDILWNSIGVSIGLVMSCTLMEGAPASCS